MYSLDSIRLIMTIGDVICIARIINSCISNRGELVLRCSLTQCGHMRCNLSAHGHVLTCHRACQLLASDVAPSSNFMLLYTRAFILRTKPKVSGKATFELPTTN